MKDSLSIAIGRILSDIRVGLSDEFDKNFERQLLHTVQSAGYRIADVQTSI